MPRREARFPVTIPAHDEVGIAIPLRQPVCHAGRPSPELPGFEVTFAVYGVHHEIYVPLDLPVIACPPPSALGHLGD